jgi:hypothetical protein
VDYAYRGGKESLSAVHDMRADAEKLKRAVESEFPHPRPLTDAIWLDVPARKVLDCVLSLNRKYDGFVVPRVRLFREKFPDVRGVEDLKDLLARYPTGEFLPQELDTMDRRRSTVLEQVAGYLWARALDFAGASEEQRLNKWAVDARPGDYLEVGAKGFGLAGFQYLRMLFGARTAKPDVHILRFVEGVIGRRPGEAEALYLLEEAAHGGGFDLRKVDVAIWEKGARPATTESNSA